MKKMMKRLSWDVVGAKEVEYRYVFLPPAGGEGLSAVCVGN